MLVSIKAIIHYCKCVYIYNIPSSIEKHISINCVNEEIIYKHSNFYNEALKESGYNCPDIKYNKDNKKKT